MLCVHLLNLFHPACTECHAFVAIHATKYFTASLLNILYIQNVLCIRVIWKWKYLPWDWHELSCLSFAELDIPTLLLPVETQRYVFGWFRWNVTYNCTPGNHQSHSHFYSFLAKVRWFYNARNLELESSGTILAIFSPNTVYAALARVAFVPRTKDNGHEKLFKGI